MAILVLAGVIQPSARCDNNGGSGYSRYGIGDLRYYPSNRAMAMGGASFAVLPPDEINEFSPAAWTGMNRLRFSVSAFYEGFSTTDGNNSAYLSGTTFNGLAIVVPILPSHGVVLGIGFSPYSRVNYNVKTTEEAGGLPEYAVNYIGDGGLSVGYVGSSVSLGSDLHLGARFNYYFGRLEYTTQQTFSSTDYTSAEVLRSHELRGIGTNVGIIFGGLKNILGIPKTHSLNLGIVFEAPSSLTTTEDRYYSYNTVTLTTRDTLSSSKADSKLPLAVGGGISYQSEELLLAADVYLQNWSDFTLGGRTIPQLRNSTRVSAGVEFVPKRDVTAPYSQRVAYRMGAFYEATDYRINGEPINEIGVTGGLGLPIIGETKLGIAAAYSFRGTTTNQLQKDKILRISVTLSGAESWFVRPPEE
jgi:hypothetical protein